MKLLLKIGRNVLGVVLILAGLIMLVTPGQGILTILLGFALMDFPGKDRITKAIMGTRVARKLKGWLRAKRGEKEGHGHEGED